MANVGLYRESDGTVPLLNWFDEHNAKIRAKCRVKIERLKSLGKDLRRPEADYLRDGIYELRVGLQGINYRMLYFFHNQKTIVISHGLIKEQFVPFKEIEKAIEHKELFEKNSAAHTHEER